MVVQRARGGRHAGRQGGGRGGRSWVRRLSPDLLRLGGRLGRRGGDRGRVGGLSGCGGLGCLGGLVSEVGAGGKREGEGGGEAREWMHWVGLAGGGWRRDGARAGVGTPGRSELGRECSTEMVCLGGPPASLPDACLPPPVCLGALVVSLVPGVGHHPSLSKLPAPPPRPRRKGNPTHALSPV